MVEDISHEGLRVLLREEGVSFQALKTWKASNDPDFEAKKNRILELYAIADGRRDPGADDPMVVICFDKFGPLNLEPRPGKQWAARSGRHADPSRPSRRRRRATYHRPHGMRHLLAAYDLSTDRLYGHVKLRKGRTEFLGFCRYIRSLHPAEVRIAVVLDNFIAHRSTHKGPQGSGVGGGQQRRAGLRPVLRQLAQQDRSAVHRPALFRPRRDRP